VLAAARGIGIEPEKPEHERNGRAEGGARRLGIVLPLLGSTLERRKNVQQLSGRRPRCNDADRCRPRELVEMRFVDRPPAETATALLGELSRDLEGRAIVGRCRARADPRQQRVGRERRKGKEKVRHVPLHVDDKYRHRIAECLFDHDGEKPRLAATVMPSTTPWVTR
jgi:hypothetical protein